MSPNKRIELYDTTLRDGTQMEGISLSVEDKLKIARKLDEIGVHYIEGGWPGSNPKDAEFFARAGLEDTAVGQGRKMDPARVAEIGYRAMLRGDGDVVAGLGNKLQAAAAAVTPQSALADRSGGRHLLQLGGQAGDLARAGVLVDHTLGDGAHQLGLGLDEGGLRGARVAPGDRFLELAQEGADARAARLVDFGPGGDLADRLLGAGVVGHR